MNIDDYENIFKYFEVRLKILEKGKVKNIQLKAELELLEQRNHLCNIELQQIPEKPNENLLQIANTIFSTVHTI